jgi:hypothetical protein
MSDGQTERRPQIRVTILDATNHHLPGVTLDYYFGEDHATIEVADIDPIISIPVGVERVRFVANYPDARTIQRIALATDGECILKFSDVMPEPSKSKLSPAFIGVVALLIAVAVGASFFNQVAATFVFGIIFLMTLLALAFVFPKPTPIQYLVMRITLALAGAGIATMLTGFIEVEIPGYLKAGGALAVFAVIYFRSPAALIAEHEKET